MRPRPALLRARLDHPPRRLARGEERAAQIDAHHAVEFLDRNVERHARRVHPGIGDRAVDRAEPCLGGIVARDHRGFVLDVHLDREGARPDLVDQRLEPVGPARRDRDLRPGPGRDQREMPPQSRRCAGDEDRAAGEVEHGVNPFYGGRDWSSPSPFDKLRVRGCCQHVQKSLMLSLSKHEGSSVPTEFTKCINLPLPLTAMLREARAALLQSRSTGVPLDEVRAMRSGRPTRRHVLAGAAATAAAILPRRSFAIGQPRVAIVGGGIAGLSCALKLWEGRRIQAQIYEWDSRVGGRIQTLRTYFANGQTTEQHAEFISSEHKATLAMAHRFGLALENTYADPHGMQDTCWFSGARYDQHALDKDWQDFGWKLFHDAVLEAPRATYLHNSRKARAWDNMSAVEWIERYVPGGMGGRFGKLCYYDVISEYGGPPESQSALNLVYLLGYDDSARDGYQSPAHPMLAGSDEKWHIKGGNDQLIDGLVSRLPGGTIDFGRQLIALAENSDGSFTLSFASGPKSSPTMSC